MFEVDVFAQNDDKLNLVDLHNTSIEQANTEIIVRDTTITFKPSAAKVSDFVDMSLEELLSVYVFVDDKGKPLPILTDENGSILGVKDTVTIFLPAIDPRESFTIIEPKKGDSDLEDIILKKITQSKSVYFYTASYHNSKLSDTLRIVDIIDLPLDELVELEVTVGGQSIVNLLQSSSNTVVITEDIINRSGYTNVGELLTCLSSMNVFNDNHALSGSVRGSLSNNFSDFAVMINGRLMNSLYSREAYLSNQFGVQNIKQIEVTYGPGLIDFPSEVCAGSINIITKDFIGKKENIEIQAELNTPRNITASLAFGKSIGKLRFNGNGRLVKDKTQNENIDEFIKFSNYFASQAPDYANGTAQEDLNEPIYTNDKLAINADAQLSYKDVYIGANFYNNKVGQNGLSTISLDYNNATEEIRQMAKGFAGFNKTFTPNRQLSAEYQFTQENISSTEKNIWVDYDYYLENSPIAPINAEEIAENYTKYFGQNGTSGSMRHTGNIRYYSLIPLNTDNYFLKGDISFTAGYEANYNDILGLTSSRTLPVPQSNTVVAEDNPVKLPQYQFLTQDAFGLIRKSLINESLFLSLGLRYAWHENYDSEYLIRSEASLKLAPKTYIKAAYNEGVLRPAVPQMLRYDTDNNWAFNEGLISSKSSVANVGFTHSFKDFVTIKSNFFHSRYSSYIFATDFGYENMPEEFISMGIETKLGINIDRFSGNADYTFQKQKENNLNYYPHNLVLIGNYNAHQYVGINIAFLMSSSLKTIDKFTEETITLPSQNFVNLNITSRTVPMGSNGSLEIICSLKNLFDTDLLYPNIKNTGSSVFLGKGRSFSTKLILKF